MMQVLQTTAVEFIRIFPILAFSIVGAEIISKFISKRDIKSQFGKGKRGIVVSTFAGLFAPGPLVAYLPALYSLRKKGLGLGYIASFTTSQTIIGSLRVLIEIYYFGMYFFIVKTCLAAIMAICVGLIFGLLEKKKVFKPVKKIKRAPGRY